MRRLLVKISMLLGIYPLMVKFDTKMRQRKERKYMKLYGLETLVEADKAVSSFGGHLFLVFGTLLGAFREKNFIAHDFDIDVGIMSSERPANMLEIMKQFGFTCNRQMYVKETGRIVEEQYEYKHVGIDFFYYFDDDRCGTDSIYTYIVYPHESKDWRDANESDGFPSVLKPSPKSDFSRQDFLGNQLYMPCDSEAWLRLWYGEHFMVPDPQWSLGNHKKRSLASGERLYRRFVLEK